MEKKRLDYLDMAKGIGIVLVLLGHLQGDQIFELSPYIHPFCVWIFSFHMPLFFIISGILIAIKNEEAKPLKVIAKKRFRGIMIPYYWFSFFYMIVVIAALIKGTIAWNTLFLQLFYVISGYGMNVLWFLPALYLGELLFFYLKKKCKSDKAFIVLSILLWLVTFIVSYLLTLPEEQSEVYKRFREIVTVFLRPVLVNGFISIGYFVHKALTAESRLGDFIMRPALNEKGKIRAGYAISYLVMGVALMGVCAAFAHVNNGIDVRSMVLRNIFFFLLCSLSGSFGLILFCKGLPTIRLLTFWGRGSLIFMATHNSETVLYYAMKSAMLANQYLTRARGYICYAIIAGIIILYSSIMIIIIQKFFPFIIGKPFKLPWKKDDSTK